MMRYEVFLSLGSNVGARAANCLKALELLRGNEDMEFVSQSSLYETDPVGYEDQASFINMAAKFTTSLTAEALLLLIKATEKSMGRKKTFKWGPRLIDIDILFFGHQVISRPGLNIPHPAMAERAFVLLPLSEIGATMEHPQYKVSVKEMANKAPGKEGVRRVLS